MFILSIGVLCVSLEGLPFTGFLCLCGAIFFVVIVVDVGTTKSGTNDHCQTARVTFQTEIRNQNLLVSCERTLPQKSQL